MNSDLEEIKSRLNIVDVLGQYLRLDKAGSNWRALCPFHNEKSPSFMVSEEKQMWHCFGCQKGGDIFSFVMEIEGLEFREALKILAERAGVELKGYSPEKAKEKNRTLEILELATKFYEIQLWQGMGKEKIMNYLHERGLQDETIKKFRLGYAPKGWRNILTFLTKRGYTLEEILKTGLLVQKEDKKEQSYDRFRERVMFPIADTTGKIVGYSARVAPGGDESQAKYINTPETEVYHKSKILYGIDQAKMEIKKKDFVLLVEGNMDVIAASQAGLENTVAVSGTALTEDQLAIIKRYTNHIKMLFDMDMAGQLATKKSIKLCFQKGIDVDIVTLGKGKDAAELAKDAPDELVLAVEKSQGAMEYFFQSVLKKYDKNKVEDKKLIAREFLEMIFHLESAIEKSHWVKKLAEELSVAESALTETLKKANLKDRTVAFIKAEKETQFIAGKKVDILVDDLIGLILVSQEASEKASREKERLAPIKDSLLGFILEEGAVLGFDFNRMIEKLDGENKERLEKIYFNKKFRLGLNNEPEEIIISQPEKELEDCILEIKKEYLKEKLEEISKNLQQAEKSKEKALVHSLRQEFRIVSDQLSSLLK